MELFTEEAELIEAGQTFSYLKERVFRDEMLEIAAAPMAVPSTRSGLSLAKSAYFRAPMVQPSSPAAKHRP